MSVDGARRTLRDEQRSVARHRVLSACVELAVRHGGFGHPERFTYARIAELAGVSERTVYRLLPTKADLIAAYLEDRSLTGGRTVPTDPTELGPFLRDVARHLDASFPAQVIGPASVAADRIDDDGRAAALADRTRRDLELHGAVAKLLPADLTDEQRGAISAVLRTVVSVQALVSSAERYGAGLVRTGDAFAWAADTLVRAIENGELPKWTSTQS
jgi:AcrR family transcriptional regulator